MSKSSGNTIIQRVSVVSALLINGNSRDSIVQYCSENWEIGERQSDKYIQKAMTLIEKSVKRNISYDYAKAVRRYEDLYKLNMDKKDYRTALAVNKELTTLQGLHKQQIEHAGEIKFISNIPD